MSAVPHTWLLVDNSNGRTKFLLSRDGELSSTPAVLSTADITPAALQELLGGWSYDAVLIASVVPACRAAFEQFFTAVPLCFLTVESNTGIDFSAYSRTLGADRVANAAGIPADGPLPAVAVDAGTAVTFDIVTEANGTRRFLGGVIAPGLPTLRGCLHSSTAQLPEAPLNEQATVLGTDTTTALQSGLLYGFIGSVREILSALTLELGTRPHVIATGGDAPLLARHLPDVINDVDPLLTFRGLAAVSKRLSV